MLSIKMKRVVLIIMSIFLTTLFIVCSFIIANKYIDSKKSYAMKLIDIIQNDKESLLTREELDDYENKIEEELKAQLNGIQDNLEIKSAYYALGAIEFLENENEESIYYLSEALKYNSDRDVKSIEDEVDIKIYSGLSSNYIKLKNLEESKVFFEEAKKIAIENNEKEVLSDLYYARAKATVSDGQNINTAIDLVIQALEYTEKDSNKVRNFLYLSKLYKLTNEFDLALEYIVNALEISMELKDNVLINDCLINLGENYYIQKNYTKTIDIYEEFIQQYDLEKNNNILKVYGYLAYCYGIKGDYENYQTYKEKYLNMTNEETSIGDLMWLYANCVEIELNFDNLETAKEYLDKAQTLYDNYSEEAEANIDILLKYSKEKMSYLENKDYDSTIEIYKDILQELNNRGVKSDIADSIMSEILTISYIEGDYETFIEYIKDKDIMDNSEEVQVYTDRIVNKMNNTIKEKEVLRFQIGAIILLIGIIISICALISIRIKNKKISELNLKLKELNIIDPLTNLYNRRYLNEKIENICTSKNEISFIMMDIDYFKLYNDNYGHINGDKALIDVAKVIKSVFKDDMVFRYGGEEFAVISDKSVEELIKYIEDLRLEIHNENIRHEYSKVSDRITLSIGLASAKLYTNDDVIRLNKIADENLYKSKQQGRNRYTY